jgi:uncharacterized protein YccT (UPF0319 family)
LEVKTTYGHERTAFWLTRREWEVAEERQDVFRIRRVFHFGDKPRMFEVPPLVGQFAPSAPELQTAGVPKVRSDDEAFQFHRENSDDSKRTFDCRHLP